MSLKSASLLTWVVPLREVPNLLVGGCIHPEQRNVIGFGEQVGNAAYQARRRVLIEQQLHALSGDTTRNCRCSRSAA